MLPRVTRRDVDTWLAGIEARLRSIRLGPKKEIVARVGMLERQVRRLRDRLGVRE